MRPGTSPARPRPPWYPAARCPSPRSAAACAPRSACHGRTRCERRDRIQHAWERERPGTPAGSAGAPIWRIGKLLADERRRHPGRPASTPPPWTCCPPCAGRARRTGSPPGRRRAEPGLRRGHLAARRPGRTRRPVHRDGQDAQPLLHVATARATSLSGEVGQAPASRGRPAARHGRGSGGTRHTAQDLLATWTCHRTSPASPRGLVPYQRIIVVVMNPGSVRPP